MPEYADGQNILSRRPEPGRPIVTNTTTKIIEKVSAPLDVNAIADAVVKALGNRVPSNTSNGPASEYIDNFDNSASLAKLADAMSSTKNNEGKVDGIGIIKETKKDEKETKKTIDLLSQLGD